MTDCDVFTTRLVAARRAAWQVFGVAVLIHLVTYGAFLGMQEGWVDGMITGGIYGDLTRGELSRLTLYYLAAFKVLTSFVMLGAIFLSLWVRALRRSATSPAAPPA